MLVAFNTSPINDLNRVRGVGTYTANILGELKKNKEITILPFEKTLPANVDIIHYPYFDLFFHTLPIKSKVKKVVTIHDVIPLVFPDHFPHGLKGNLNLFFQKMALKNVDAVICDSKTSKKDIVDKLNYPEKKIHVVYLAAGNFFKKISDSKEMSSVIEKYNLPQKFVLYVGDINWNKNITNLLEAIKIAKVNLVMVGKTIADETTAQSKEITSQIKKIGIESKVLKIGFVQNSDLVTIYNLAQVTLTPSQYEGFGLPVLESMACGTPVICSNNSSLAEIAPPQAILCNPDNPNDIAQKITKVFNLPQKTKDLLSKKLIAHAAKFTWQKTAQETIAVYKHVLKDEDIRNQ